MSTSSPDPSRPCPQHQVRRQLRRLGPTRPLISQRMRRRRPVALGAHDVARQLTRDRRRRTPQTVSDLGDAVPAGAGDRDLLPLSKRQTTTLQIASATRTHTAGLTQPTPPFLPIRTCLGRSTGDELTPRHRRPERLKHLSNHVLREPHAQHLQSVRCCDHRKNPRIPHRTRTGLRQLASR